MTQLFFQMSASDIETLLPMKNDRRSATGTAAHELRKGGVVMQDENVKVTAALVNHPPVVPSFGYRFDTADRSIVISGDADACPVPDRSGARCGCARA